MAAPREEDWNLQELVNECMHTFPCTTTMKRKLNALKDGNLTRQVLPCLGLSDLNDWTELKNRRNSDLQMVNIIPSYHLIP